MARIDAFFKLMTEQKASDLHLSTNNAPMLRINGDLVRVDFPPLKNDELKAMVYEIAPEGKIKEFEEKLDVDFGYEVPDVMRYRVNFFQQKYGISAAFRSIPSQVLTVDDLGLPAVLKRFPMLKKGLVLVTGPTGSGKSTTLAAMIDHANLHRHDHIITVEDPIEFVHRSQNCLVQHREVGVHTRSFANALRGALREDPDILLVGEMRDLETIELALTAAATGHLRPGGRPAGQRTETAKPATTPTTRAISRSVMACTSRRAGARRSAFRWRGVLRKAEREAREK